MARKAQSIVLKVIDKKFQGDLDFEVVRTNNTLIYIPGEQITKEEAKGLVNKPNLSVTVVK